MNAIAAHRRRRRTALVLALLCGATALAGAAAAEAPREVPIATAAAATTDAATRLATWQRRGFGMFVHWGLYSALGGVWNGAPVRTGYSEQIEKWGGIPHAEYMRVAERFAAPRFDPDALCALARRAGARYIVVTAKHHDGFAMFDTGSTGYDIVDATPFGRDPLALLAQACRRQGLGFGFYFSLVDWNAGHVFDPDNDNPVPASMQPLIERQLRELLTRYGPIAEVWFDMASPTPAQSRRFAAIVRELQPGAAINGRVWNNAGDFITLGDNQAPPASMEPPFQVPASIYHATWGYRSWQRRDDRDGKIRELTRGLAATRAAGGNYLLNIGPKGDGSIVPFEAQVLAGIGDWLRRHPEAVLDAAPSGLPAQDWGSTALGTGDASGSVFAHVADWPRDGQLRIKGLDNAPTRVLIDGGDARPLAFRRDGHDLLVELPAQPTDPVLPVLRVELAGPLRAIPDRHWIVQPGATLRLGRAGWRDGVRYRFGSGYYSQRDARTSIATTLLAPRATTVRLRFDGVAAAPDLRYRIRAGTTERVLAGRDLAQATIGPLTLATGSVTPVEIRLAEPAYAAQDLQLLFDAMVLEPVR